LECINTVTGMIGPRQLGRTLMHEHLFLSMPGAETDWLHPGPNHRDMVARCVDQIEELKSAGFSSLLDPCPNDLGRNVDLMGEVAARTGFNVICATGLYNQDVGATMYWRMKMMIDPHCAQQMAELFIHELTRGIGATGIRAGVIKVATGHAPITDYEKMVLQAAATASLETGVPITTHTDAILGDQQIAILTGHGVPAHRLIIGHSCGSGDHDYHMQIVRQGAYIGFDRFGGMMIRPDEERITSLLHLLHKGALKQVIISHDSAWCMRGVFPPEIMAKLTKNDPLHFTRNIVPKLMEAGVTPAQIDTLLIENPCRFFEGE